MKHPRACQHQDKVKGPCWRCSMDFQTRYSYSRSVGIKGIRVSAAIRDSFTVADWAELERLVSDITGTQQHVPVELSVSGWVPLTRDELPE